MKNQNQKTQTKSNEVKDVALEETKAIVAAEGPAPRTAEAPKAPKVSTNKLFLEFGYNTPMRKDLIKDIVGKYMEAKKNGTAPEKISEFVDQVQKTAGPKDVINLIHKRDGRHFQFLQTDVAKALSSATPAQ